MLRVSTAEHGKLLEAKKGQNKYFEEDPAQFTKGMPRAEHHSYIDWKSPPAAPQQEPKAIAEELN